jgi:iron complex transport system ATP-binding protein
VTLSVERGELVVLIGPNGSGKSTLLRVLSGLVRARLGAIKLFGCDVAGMSRLEVARQVALVSQANDVTFGYRVKQVVMMGRSPHQGGLLLATREDVDAAREAMEKTGVTSLADRPVAELSGGEQKLVALARAFAQRTDVLLLDEPSAHLDPHHAVALFELVLSEVHGRGLACIAVAHDLNLAAAFADRVVLLENGGIRASGSVADVMTHAHLAAVFGAELEVVPHAGGPFFVPRRRRRTEGGVGKTGSA